jgi:sec-independent protein translocase protein TatC
LYARERKWAYIFTGTAVPLFVSGAALAYFVMDRGLHYLLDLTPASVGTLISVDSYIGYFMGMLVGFGIVFELPLVIVMLNVAGILTHERFRKWRRMMIFAIFLISGLVNPSPDPWTMLILGGVAVVLTEAAEVFVYFNDKRRARRNPSPYADLADDELAPIEDPEPIDADNSR